MISHKHILKIASTTPEQFAIDKCKCYVPNTYESEIQCPIAPVINKNFCEKHIIYEHISNKI
jgi:hypothetical protein